MEEKQGLNTFYLMIFTGSIHNEQLYWNEANAKDAIQSTTKTTGALPSP